MTFENKLVVLVNKEIETGVAMNAVAHASLAIGALIGKENLHIEQYKDANGNIWPISGMPYIVLRGKSSEIRKAVTQVREEGMLQISFLETMTGGTYQEQMERTLQVEEENHIYYAAALFGAWDKISQITKRFSLYK